MLHLINLKEKSDVMLWSGCFCQLLLNKRMTLAWHYRKWNWQKHRPVSSIIQTPVCKITLMTSKTRPSQSKQNRQSIFCSNWAPSGVQTLGQARDSWGNDHPGVKNRSESWWDTEMGVRCTHRHSQAWFIVWLDSVWASNVNMVLHAPFHWWSEVSEFDFFLFGLLLIW